MAQPLWRTVQRFLRKLKIELSYYPAIPFLGIYVKEIKKKDILPFATTCMNPKGIMLSEIKSDREMYCMISLICGI